MQTLLINPNREQMPWPTIPVGLCSIATSLLRRGHDVDLLDLTFSRDLVRDTRRALQRRPPDVVGLTVRNIDNCNFESPVFYLEEVRDRVIRTVRQHAPHAQLVIGGSAVNVSPWDCYQYLGADYAIVGEGEDAFGDFLDALAGKAVLDTVAGLLAPRLKSPSPLPILDTGRLSRGEPIGGRALVGDLTEAARSEAWRWVDLERYNSAASPYSIQTKRGCALKCSYCVYNNIEGHAYRLREAAEVVDEIEEAVGHGARQIDFVDSTFNLPMAHARGLCEALSERKLNVELSTMGLNPAGLTPDLVDAMKRAGFKSVMCTPESASDITLKSLNKGFKKHAVQRAARLLGEAGLPTYWFFMLGAPGETMATVRETLSFCEQHIPATDMVLFSTGIRVYSGTPLEVTCKKMGWFAADDPLFEPSWFLSPEVDLEELYATLVQAAKRHHNWMTNAETIVSPALRSIMKNAIKIMGWRGPFWQHLPKLFRFVSHFGARQRGLNQHAHMVSNIEDIAHHH